MELCFSEGHIWKSNSRQQLRKVTQKVNKGTVLENIRELIIWKKYMGCELQEVIWFKE